MGLILVDSGNVYQFTTLGTDTTSLAQIAGTQEVYTKQFLTGLTASGSVIISGSLNVIGSLQLPNRVAFRVSGSSVAGIAATTTITATQGAVVDYNQGGYYNNTTGIFTATQDGMYHVYLNCRVQLGGSQQVIVYKNNTTPMLMWEAANNTGAVHFGVSGVLKLETNDTLRAKVTVGTVQFDSNDSWGATYIG